MMDSEGVHFTSHDPDHRIQCSRKRRRQWPAIRRGDLAEGVPGGKVSRVEPLRLVTTVEVVLGEVVP